ncbi:hypothetical protein SB775_22305 [Peribacillus sp. SIMBA_075]|uniref:hypothetical protein n=1 Tax=Peribacillus sp. SIMBA_075 TaxID=3085813 RepID=UPI00397CB825
MSEQAAVESIGKEEVNQGSKWWKWLIGGSLLASSVIRVYVHVSHDLWNDDGRR